jgi:quercetin dioxygenase-like cupin family protein
LTHPTLRHFVSHLDEIVTYVGEGSYAAKRLVLYPIGATGYVHATLLMLAPGTKVLSHWHDDREAVFYCVAGSGSFVLDEVEHEATAGSAMHQTWQAVHGLAAVGSERFDVLDLALFTDHGKHRDPESCFTVLDPTGGEATDFGRRIPLVSQDVFASDAVRFVGELVLRDLFTEKHVERGTEQILLVLSGSGAIHLLDQRVPIRPGSILYLIDFPFGIKPDDELRLVGASSRMGRISVPPLFANLMARARL